MKEVMKQSPGAEDGGDGDRAKEVGFGQEKAPLVP